jgi:hypothetical protein
MSHHAEDTPARASSESIDALVCLDSVTRRVLALVVLLGACAPEAEARIVPEPRAAPPAAMAVPAPPAVDCALGSPAPFASLDARAIDALRRDDRIALGGLAAPGVDPDALVVAPIPPELPYVGCTAHDGAVVTRYLGLDGGAHELHLEWRWTDRWVLARAERYGW